VLEDQQVELAFNLLRHVLGVHAFLFCFSVEFNAMKVYSLALNGKPICEVEMEAPSWLPVRPRVNKAWLTALAAQALRELFPTQVYLKRDTKASSTVFN
jgi:hypothetical protein